MVADTAYRLKEQTKEIVAALIRDGVALVHLDDSSVPEEAFAAAKQAFKSDIPSSLHIPDGAGSAHVTGYHATGGLSARYNQYRHGFVWSDGHTLVDADTLNALPEDFHTRTKNLQELLHQTTDHVLDGLQQHLELPDHWLQNTLGPFPRHSQWHLKGFVNPPSDNTEWLPTHTDPSLISIVMHDVRSSTGLQCLVRQQWHDVSHNHSNQNIAVVLVGSVLQYLTANFVSACRHRVVYSQPNHTAINQRLAATLFVRPRPDAMLQLPPSTVLQDRTLKKRLNFEQWNARTARNYEKARNAVDTKSKTSCTDNKPP